MESDLLSEGAFSFVCLSVCFAQHGEQAFSQRGDFLPKSLATLGSIPWGGGQVQLPKLAAPALRLFEVREGLGVGALAAKQSPI